MNTLYFRWIGSYVMLNNARIIEYSVSLGINESLARGWVIVFRSVAFLKIIPSLTFYD